LDRGWAGAGGRIETDAPGFRWLKHLEVVDFRCVARAELTLHPELSLVLGRNASGKTTLLESLFFLGRGRSFRQGPSTGLIRQGAAGFLLAGSVGPARSDQRVAVQYETGRFRVKIGGEERQRLADLASWVPVSVIDPEVHELVQGAPEHRRRFLDWGVFHVEQDFGETWRRYQRALRQRNAALRQGADAAALSPWSRALAPAGEAIGAARERYVERLAPTVETLAAELAGIDLRLRYQPGWSRGKTLADALEDSVGRDQILGTTQSGPHRADLLVEFGPGKARQSLSRGQQKLVAAALVLAQVRELSLELGVRPLLLLDDPAAELDDAAQARLIGAALQTPAQRVMTGLRPSESATVGPHALFHVEQGRVSQVL
jgi:DNA replication and repair protein RecF